MPSCNNCVSSKYCDNIIMMDNKKYYLEKVWRNTKRDSTKDFKGKIFPFPKHNKNILPENKYIIEQ